MLINSLMSYFNIQHLTKSFFSKLTRVELLLFTPEFTISYFFGKPLSAHLAKTEVTLLLSETPVFEKLYETETGKYLKTKDVGK